ncbi:Rhodanese-like domain-containing protein [Crassisporium funariophilum]|nr:Rhodanese-like domain-containing protein [Crassisporium funariophilum]
MGLFFCRTTLLARKSHFSFRKMTTASPLLLSPKQVNDLTTSSPASVKVLDATWFMPNSPRKANTEFLAKRIPGSQFLDLDEVASSHDLGLKHMMPDTTIFAQACEKLGISPTTHVIFYDSHGVFSAPRALFMFRCFGHQNSSIIDGGLPRWADEGLPLEADTPTQPQPAHYPVPGLNDEAIKSYDQIVSNSRSDPSKDGNTSLVLDARAHGRFTGTDPEPRPGLSSGHIPHSLSLPFNMFLQKHQTKEGGEYTTFLPPSEIRQALSNAVGPAELEKIMDGKRSVVTSCGSGMSAAVLWLGLQLLGVQRIGLYDESWTGYAMRPSSQIEKSL